jgi:threonine 3-dehydrogenase
MKTTTAGALAPPTSGSPPTTMRALVKERPGAGMSLREVPVPSIGPTDVLIRVHKAGICGTDQHIWNWDPWAAARVHPPCIIGHEFMGVVAAVGESVRTVAVGERVSAEGHIADGTCLLCRTGQPHICVAVKVIGVDRDGCFADYISMPERNVWKLDASVPDTWAAIFDPFGNAVHTVSEAHVSLKSVLITGAGSIGLMAVSVAAAAGASKIIAIDPNPHKRELAKQLGAHAVFDSSDRSMRGAILELVGDAGPDVFLEMSGSGSALESGLSLLRHGGRAAILGISAGKVTLDVSELIVLKGITVLGIFGRKIWETWYQMQQLVKDGRVDLAPVISHVVPFERFEECFTTLKQRDAVKIVLDIAWPAS